MLEEVKRHFQWFYRRNQTVPLAILFTRFQSILRFNNQILELMADMNDKSGGDYVFDSQYILTASRKMSNLVENLIADFNVLVDGKYREISEPFKQISREIEAELQGRRVVPRTPFVLNYKDITIALADVVGGKNANLAELKNQLDIPAPGGFAITVSAYHKLLDDSGLSETISAVVEDYNTGKIAVNEASGKIQSMILGARIPDEVQKAVRDAVSRARKNIEKGSLFWAIRSSALGEDSEHSFAGQFVTRLNVASDDVMDAYRQVLASTYSASAMTYRAKKGISDNEVAMAVACQQLIRPHKSGAILTLDPMAPEAESMVLSATWGLGAPIVSGKMEADQFHISRKPPHPVTAMDITRKSKRMVPLTEGGCAFEDVEPDQQTRCSLTEEEIVRIAEAGMKIEKYFRKPQEVEWAIDAGGDLFIVQARPLNMTSKLKQMVCDISDVISEHPIIFSRKGVIAQEGIASGKVFIVRDDQDLIDFPSDSILVAKQSSPKFTAVVGRANGIITDIGSSTGHMATIVREFRIPTILNTGIATNLLHTGQEITMDAQENVVYEGIVKELCFYDFVGQPFEETYEYRLMRRVLKKISPLYLIDPNSKNFAPRSCRTYHDITRFIHEKAVAALINLKPFPGRMGKEARVLRLESDIPIDLRIIDIGGGVMNQKRTNPIQKEQIISRPMRAFLIGLQSAGAWNTDPMAVDFKGFMSSLTRTFSPELATPKYIGQNLAIISKEYININLRLGYHFNLIDVYMSDQINDNYIYFRFLGGVTDQARRDRRAKLIATILKQNDFVVQLRHDLVIGRIKKLNPALMSKKVKLLGQLVAFSRQLDVQMNSDAQIDIYLSKFNELIQTGSGVSQEHAYNEEAGNQVS